MYDLHSWPQRLIRCWQVLCRFLSTLRKDRLSHNSKPQHHMLCLSVLCLSRDHFNHLCSINGKITTTYISPRETKKTLSFRYELLGSFRSVNRNQGCSFKIMRSQSKSLKARSRSVVWKRWPRALISVTHECTAFVKAVDPIPRLQMCTGQQNCKTYADGDTTRFLGMWLVDSFRRSTVACIECIEALEFKARVLEMERSCRPELQVGLAFQRHAGFGLKFVKRFRADFGTAYKFFRPDRYPFRQWLLKQLIWINLQ